MARAPSFYADGRDVIDASNGERFTLDLAELRAEVMTKVRLDAKTDELEAAVRRRQDELISAIRAARSHTMEIAA